MTTAAAAGVATPAGTWAADVARPAGTVRVVLHLTAQGRAFLLTGGGAGTWTADGPGRFRITVAEAIVGPGETYRGWVLVEQRATLDGDTFRATGTSTVFGPDGERRYTATTGMHARR